MPVQGWPPGLSVASMTMRTVNHSTLASREAVNEAELMESGPPDGELGAELDRQDPVPGVVRGARLAGLERVPIRHPNSLVLSFEFPDALR